ncbi:MAG: LytTR family transcriptional regulator DNA-binding domain-containing protein [Saprospiraceae bacterium]|nr:LytTR family transcriptional regulator DNA-binding domain-containing protein [Saprospiraceae bacterium]
MLVDKNFYRAHRSFLVNKYHIQELIESRFVHIKKKYHRG